MHIRDRECTLGAGTNVHLDVGFSCLSAMTPDQCIGNKGANDKPVYDKRGFVVF